MQLNNEVFLREESVMKKVLSLVLGGAFLLFQSVVVWAAPTTFTVSATVPSATGVGVTVSSVSSASNAFTTQPAGTTALSFDPMTFNTTNNIYLPNHYYALDFAVSGGSGSPDVTVSYNEGSNPNGSTNGLGYKSTATFAKEVSNGTTNTETFLTAHGPKKRLIDLSGEHVGFTELTGGFLRMYLGVWTGSTTAPADPTNGQPFTAADGAGTYTGSLVVTAVVN
jgi:hypothetical protein